MNGWRAGYSESCKSGSGASARKPTATMRQGAGYLAYSMRSALRITGTTIPKRSYHEIRRASDRLCKEHGLSVVTLGRNNGKSYIEHTATQARTSYKAKLKATIDRLIPVSADFEDLLRRLQQEGYEIKWGKYVSCRASDQERFTRMKTLGVDYTEDAIAARIAGDPRPSRQPKQRDDRIRLLYDLQSKQGGLQHWAKLQNLKLAAKTFA